MNFITFGTQFTNIFPAANLQDGSQLLTEWNMRSRDMIVTDPKVTYEVGPSFVHGEEDFEVDVLKDSGGALVNTYTLSVAPGRAIVNGHFVETLAPMTVDLVEANATLLAQSRPVLKGALAIGIRTFYATEETVAGSILADNGNDMLLGVQLVVLPEEELIVPSETPLDKTRVTADIKLATFTYLNNRITDIRNLNTTKLQYMSSKRIINLDNVVSQRYVTKTGLNSKKLYAFAGKGTDPATGHDTWEDVTDSMMIWDADPQRTSVKPTYQQAQLVTVGDAAYFVIPHKQVTGMTDDEDNPEYYAPRIMEFPTADYTNNTVGFVNKSYTKQIKDIANQVSQFRSFLTGKQIYFMEIRTVDDELPAINDSWENGDYILVQQDQYYRGADASDDEGSPSTMYAVIPGQVLSVQFVSQLDGDALHDPGVPDNIVGAELGHQDWYESAGAQPPETAVPEYYPSFWGEGDNIIGTPGDASTNQWVDYFRIRYYKQDDPDYGFTDYFYAVLTAGPRTWSGAILVTGAISLANEDTIGGFLNVSEDATDYGYVYLDDTGHLRLLDYQLLRSGTLAYQIGSDLTLPTASDIAELQSYISEYVNDRVAFPTSAVHTSLPSVLNIYIDIPETDEGGTLEIAGIDSRFNTAVCLHFQGNASSNVTINISDCQKLQIDSTIGGNPVINIFRCCLYYDPVVLQYIKTCPRDESIYGTYTGFRDLSLWYEQLTDENPPLVVSGMTVSELDAAIISTDINYWSEIGAAINDNNYLVALKSITFSGAGDIVGVEVLVANNSTDNILPGDKIVVGNFILPQGSTLVYPTACLTRVLKVCGQFTTAYYSDSNWYVTDTSFTLATGTYSSVMTTEAMTGTVAFHSVTALVPSTISQTSIDVWEPDSYNLFRGGAIS